MFLGLVPARAAITAYSRLSLYSRQRYHCIELLLVHKLHTPGLRFTSNKPAKKHQEGKKRSKEHKTEPADRQRTTATVGDNKRRKSQPKQLEIAYEPYWTEEAIAELESKQPELVIRGTVTIPAFATAEAKVVTHTKTSNSKRTTDSNKDAKGGSVCASSDPDVETKQSIRGDDGRHESVNISKELDSKIETQNNRRSRAFESDVEGDGNRKDNYTVRVFGFLARNRAFHGDDVVAIKQRRQRTPPTNNSHERAVSDECRVVSVTKRSSALESFVGVLDIEVCKDETQEAIKCQPHDTRWPAFNVRRCDIDAEIKQQFSQFHSKGKIFCLMRFQQWNENDMEPTGLVTKIIGDVSNPSARMQALMVFHGLNPNGFSEQVIKNLNELIKTADETKDKNRVDRRDLTVFTIDPQDAKDLDDALSVEIGTDDNGNYKYTVGVHIADVSHYVKEGSLVDLDARQRATSVYMEHQVFPMLPQMLSENLCSLLPHSEKLCFSMFADLVESHNGGELIGNNLYIRNVSFQLTRIFSCQRLSYQTAKEIIHGELGKRSLLNTTNLESMSMYRFQRDVMESNDGHLTETNVPCENRGKLDHPRQRLKDGYDTKTDITKPLLVLYFISRKLRDFRLRQRGAVTVDISGNHKCHIPKVGENTGRFWVEEIPTESHELVEEMMLLANTQAAQLLAKSFDRYFLRVHENTSRAVKQLVTSMMPQELKKIINPEVLQIPELLRKCAKHMEPTAFQSLSFAALQQFKEAVYSPINRDETSTESVTSHWGLALPMYLHFTSPIRRYSDLYTHRMLKTVIDNTYTEQSLKVLDEICKRCNMQKRKAFDVQKEYKNFAFNQYLQWACTKEDGSQPYAATDDMFAKAYTKDDTDAWGMVYNDACVFSVVLGTTSEGAQNNVSIVFYIPLLNEQRSVSCKSLNVEPIQAIVGGEKKKLDAGKATCNQGIVDGYHKELQNDSSNDKREDDRVHSITVRKGDEELTLYHYQRIKVVLVPGSQMWTLRLAND
ncbi:DIS3-like exonuclease 2 [Babesia sp. Xinjiang]|uniref:DIS3-like exonuclease 2 n=1 Tax=Babesia sp. Xinjiang TaxID=462227 RepID=UPI000A25D032|nr:DIS3-like exonuclease 2 [Babesia sp. Xinjiang]ORM39770.1 DIS3-like exonuclease 2 [Babesia sp. Xinjiang]